MGMIDRVFGISPEVLSLRSKRTEMISANLANADTPGYKAVDLDFKAALENEMGMGGLRRTNERHMSVSDGAHGEMLYRVPAQPSLDGNTVESDWEHMAFMENAVRYEASISFLDARIKSTLAALRGE
jgi:flagellar basal-body rod protein FlgB